MHLSKDWICARPVLLLIACVIPTNVTAYGHQGTEAPIKLRLQFKAGEVTKYKAEVITSIAAPAGHPSSHIPPSTRETTVTQTVLKVLPDGSAQIRTVTDSPLNVSLLAKPGSKNVIKAVSVVSPEGEVKSVSFADKEQSAGGYADALYGLGIPHIYLPPHPVHVGDSWDVPNDILGFKVSGRAKLVKLLTYGSHTTVVIHTTLALPNNDVLEAFGGGNFSGMPKAKVMVYMTTDTDFGIDSGRIVRTVTHSVMDTRMPLPPDQQSVKGAPGEIDIKYLTDIDMRQIP
jgi:hypothetical protein